MNIIGENPTLSATLQDFDGQVKAHILPLNPRMDIYPGGRGDNGEVMNLNKTARFIIQIAL